MKKSEFINIYALNEKSIAMLERCENIAKTCKTVKNVTIKQDYETINNECDTKSARYDYFHIVYEKHNIIECYAKKNNTLYCLVRTSVCDYDTLAKNFTTEIKSNKLSRVIISDNDFSKLYDFICKAITKASTDTKTTITKKASATKKTVKKEA